MDKFDLSIKNEYVFDEKGNTILTLRDESWGGRDYKLSIRKCYVDKEGNSTPNKGVSFLTDRGAHNLTNELVRRGFGDSDELVSALESRGADVSNISTNSSDEEYHDPGDIFATGVEDID